MTHHRSVQGWTEGKEGGQFPHVSSVPFNFLCVSSLPPSPFRATDDEPQRNKLRTFAPPALASIFLVPYRPERSVCPKEVPRHPDWRGGKRYTKTVMLGSTWGGFLFFARRPAAYHLPSWREKLRSVQTDKREKGELPLRAGPALDEPNPVNLPSFFCRPLLTQCVERCVLFNEEYVE